MAAPVLFLIVFLVPFAVSLAFGGRRLRLGALVFLGGSLVLSIAGWFMVSFHPTPTQWSVRVGTPVSSIELKPSAPAGSGTMVNRLTVGEHLPDCPQAAAMDWTAVGEGKFEPEVYPSRGSGLVAAARKMLKSMDRVIDPKTPNLTLRILGNLDRAMVERVAGAIEKEHPELKIAVGEKPQTTQAANSGLVLRFDQTGSGSSRQEVGPIPYVENQERFLVTLEGPAGRITDQLEVVDKPWVDNFAQLVNENPKRSFLLAQSPEPAVSRDEALRDALRDGARQMVPLVRNLVTVSGPNDEQRLFQVVYAKLSQGRGISDRFVQRVKMSVSPMWREVLLIDASPEKLQEAAAMYRVQGRLAKATWFKFIGSTAGLVLVICLAYAFANLATRGYYTWSLRIVAVVFGLLGLFVLLRIS